MVLCIRDWGLVDYAETFAAMQQYVARRAVGHEPLQDALWLCEHPSVFTQGLAGGSHHVLNAGDIPVVQSNRGGQVTYHGPGQVVAYPLVNLQGRGYFVKEYVYRLEKAVLRTLAHFGVTGHHLRGAPGVYVRMNDPKGHAMLTPRQQALSPLEAVQSAGLGKIAAVGIKVSRHFTLHGLALNVAMDLEPFTRINPCGYAGLQAVDLRSLGVDVGVHAVREVLTQALVQGLV